MDDHPHERLKKWRLILGKAAEAEGDEDPAEATSAGDTEPVALSAEEQGMDDVLEALYQEGREGSLGPSSPHVNRWLGDIRTYFPSSVVRIMQQDALDRLGLERMLLEPELLDQLEPDVHLVASLLSLRQALPDRTRDTARLLVRRVAEAVEKRLRLRLEQAVRGSLRRQGRAHRPRYQDIHWDRTIRANLKHYQPEWNTIIPERLIGHQRRRPQLRDIILLLDLSGSMSGSVVYAGLLGSILASLPALRTRLITFDTSIADLTQELGDPVDLLFGLQLGGGTDIGQALGYARNYIERPADTIVFLISDLYEGVSARRALEQAAAIQRMGAQLIALLALDDSGTPAFDHTLAERLAQLEVPAFASTPDAFPEVLSAAIERRGWERFGPVG